MCGDRGCPRRRGQAMAGGALLFAHGSGGRSCGSTDRRRYIVAADLGRAPRVRFPTTFRVEGPGGFPPDGSRGYSWVTERPGYGPSHIERPRGRRPHAFGRRRLSLLQRGYRARQGIWMTMVRSGTRLVADRSPGRMAIRTAPRRASGVFHGGRRGAWRGVHVPPRRSAERVTDLWLGEGGAEPRVCVVNATAGMFKFKRGWASAGRGGLVAGRLW